MEHITPYFVPCRTLISDKFFLLLVFESHQICSMTKLRNPTLCLRRAEPRVTRKGTNMPCLQKMGEYLTLVLIEGCATGPRSPVGVRKLSASCSTLGLQVSKPSYPILKCEELNHSTQSLASILRHRLLPPALYKNRSIEDHCNTRFIHRRTWLGCSFLLSLFEDWHFSLCSSLVLLVPNPRRPI